MRQQQLIRFIEQISYLLKLSQPCSKTAIQYFMKFKQYQNHQQRFDQQIVVAACIYLSAKIFQQEIRVRDILNMVYVLTRAYRLGKCQEQKERQLKQQIKLKQKQQQKYKQQIKLKQQQQKYQKHQQNKHQQVEKHDSIKQNNPQQNQLHLQPQQHQKQPFILLKTIQSHPHLHQSIQPNYSLSDYNQYKSKIIQAEQTLLRILGFDFSLSQQNRTQLKQLLLTMHYMNMPGSISESVLRVYNDVHYIDVQCWLEGVVYFGWLLIKGLVRQRQQKQYQIIKSVDNNNGNNVIVKQLSSKQFKQTQRIKQFNQKMNSPQVWQLMLCTSIKQLQAYSQTLANFYLNLANQLQ